MKKTMKVAKSEKKNKKKKKWLMKIILFLFWPQIMSTLKKF